MHSVSPVHIRVESNVKNPMTATNFQDTVKTKKKVKIGPSVIFRTESTTNHTNTTKPKQTNNKTSRDKSPKSRSLSPKPKSGIHWCPPPGKTTKPTPQFKGSQPDLMKTCRLSDLDHIPERDSSSSKASSIPAKKTLPICQVCIEARSRSQSPHKLSEHYTNLNTNNNNNNHNDLNSSRSSTFLSRTSSDPASLNTSDDYISFNRNRSNKQVPSSKNQRYKSEERRLNALNDPNSTYTLPYSRSRSHESLMRSFREDCLPYRIDPISYSTPPPPPPPYFHDSLPASNVINNREFLVQKLIETESFANNIVHQLSLLKDFLIIETNNPHQVLHNAPIIIKRFEFDRDELLKQLEFFELANRDLKDTIYDFTSPANLNDLRQLQENSTLIKQIDALEIENNHLKKMLLEFEKSVCLTGNTNEALNLENNALANLKASLEDNRAHLRRQLLARESEVSRLNVQIRNITQKFDRAQLEIELLRENREKAGLAPLKFPDTTKKPQITNKKTNPANIKLNKNVYNLEEILSDPIKTRLYIDKLNIQVKEKDAVIRNLNETIVTKQKSEAEAEPSTTETRSSERSAKLEAERLRKENEKLKASLHVKEERLKSAESKLKNYSDKKYSTLISASASNKRSPNQQNSSSGDDATQNLQSISQSTSPVRQASNMNSKNAKNSEDNQEEQAIQRIKNFSEIELNNVRSRLQERLNELEPLPELLKNTELKLHEAMIKIKNYEVETTEYKKLINDLRLELESSHVANKATKESKKIKDSQKANIMLSSTLASAIQAETNAKQQALLENLTQSKLEPIEKRILGLEEDNKELHRQLSVKDEHIRELSNKLSNKTNESSSFSRQLELALSDAAIKEHQLKEKYSSKERNLQAKCAELETKLNSIQMHSTVNKRDKEDLVQEYQNQIRDLKARLEQLQLTNKQMQEYVNFLKNSYVTYFNDNTLHSFESGSGNNFLGSQNNFY